MKENPFIRDKLKKIAISNYLKEKLKKAGFIDLDIEKSANTTKVVIYALKPSFVIGKKGTTIRALTDDLEKEFGLSRVRIEIGEIPNKHLDPKVILENMQIAISRRRPWKSVVYNALREIKEAGAIGAEIIVKGNLAGKGERKRKARFYFGYLKKAGAQKDLVAYDQRTTYPSLGTIGIKIRITRPGTVFSDKIDVTELAKLYKIKREEEIINKSKTEQSKSEELQNETKQVDNNVVEEIKEEAQESGLKIKERKKRVVKPKADVADLKDADLLKKETQNDLKNNASLKNIKSENKQQANLK
ncbi:MAG TPA: 30S ribosomal protein S3 [archaeon]|nr:30S ribosomal protein S3 [archaeon]HRT02357.1 30S ribosomal protein S3 [Candidatus Diapherotrites archaeon]